MKLHKLWPTELQTHYWRLDDNIRNFILTKMKEKTIEKSNLMNFIATIDELIESKGKYMSNSEFLFLAAATKVVQGESEAIQNICSLDEFHPGLHNAKAFSLISQKKFTEVPSLIKYTRG
ncbi:MAG: hypothetical protein ACTSPM_02610 [Candidatus Heimdallarchaeota archaeon]